MRSKQTENPFEYEAATNLSDEMILDFYIDDFNHTRFIQSKRNIFLIGDRGSGKTMALLYNKWSVQALRAKRDGELVPASFIGIYVPCNTPLTHRAEYQLLDKFQAGAVSEHFLALSIACAIVDTLSDMGNLIQTAEQAELKKEAQFVLAAELPDAHDLFDALRQFFQQQLLATQRAINRPDSTDVFYTELYSFASLVVPLLTLVRRLGALGGSHFLLMIDDAQSLNEYQVRALNSWVSFRDHAYFSFKIAVAKVDRPTKKTSTGGSILEGHDFTSIDLEEPYQNKDSDFGKLAARVVETRLRNVNILSAAADFFPINESMKRDLEIAKETARAKAIEMYGEGSAKKIVDYVYKYARAYYFRDRSPKANRVPYSGFETIVFLSTGVIRNLLEPCYWMYDKMLSGMSEGGELSPDVVIAPAVQTDVIMEHSRRLWDWLRDGLDQDIEGCSSKDATEAYRLLDKLADLFRERLLRHESEPRAVSFTISEGDGPQIEPIKHLLEILRKAQLLYVRSGPAKDKGRREIYYVPNRMLWPDRGLDPKGQHARVSIRSRHLYLAATENRPIPFDGEITRDDAQPGLWGNDDAE